ncbi:glycosyltransferase family 2 protein [Leptospira idonii]|uniref:Glycosyltransferase family 2 protein n=2 Tax=Leptospira idonii TaxID=1193500 RepID=A0A4R9M0R8_9LEPT|nr:glycosyltransferase family 2 protein [Leptospira idonii]
MAFISLLRNSFFMKSNFSENQSESDLPLISVAMATYNGDRYLEEQIDSILSQTYPNLEIVICDDLSRDSTREILQRYEKAHDNVSLIFNSENKGVVRSFETAISLCKGDFIALSDQDDIFLPEKIFELYRHIGDAYLIHCDSVLIDSKGNTLHPSYFAYSKTKDKHVFTDYLLGNNVTGNSVLIRKELARFSLPFPKGIRMHDHYLALAACYLGKIEFFDLPLQLYRQHDKNVIGANLGNFDTFLKESRKGYLSDHSILRAGIFPKYKKEIELQRDFKRAIFKGKWKSRYSLLKLLDVPGGKKMMVYYFLFCGFWGDPIRNLFYSLLTSMKKTKQSA